jgi:hypothetical protein
MERNTNTSSTRRVFRKPTFTNRPARSGGRSFAGRSSFGGRGHSRGSRGNNRGAGAYINPERFVNRAVITEEVARFIPEHKFADFAIDERLKANIITKGYVDPTPFKTERYRMF